MDRLVVRDGYAMVYLNRNFYRKECIAGTLEEYDDFISGQVADVGDYIVVKIKSKSDDYSERELAREFLNYVLAMEYQVKG